ncbi:hypothetical protein ERS043885_02480, partial [Streptococcus pneumoniae]
MRKVLKTVRKISLFPYSGSEKARADSGVSSLLNSSKACLKSLYWLSAYE